MDKRLEHKIVFKGPETAKIKNMSQSCSWKLKQQRDHLARDEHCNNFHTKKSSSLQNWRSVPTLKSAVRKWKAKLLSKFNERTIWELEKWSKVNDTQEQVIYAN